MPTDPLRIRDAQAGDAGVIVEFNTRLAAETEDKSLDRARLTQGVGALLADSAKGRYFVAESNGVPIGQLMVTTEWSDWRNGEIWWLQSVYVRPDHRRRGVFRRLFRHVAALAQSEPDVVGLRLYVEQRNAVARAVYQRCGLEPAGYDVLELLWETVPPNPPIESA